MPGTRRSIRKKILIVGIMLAIALVHLALGRGYAGPCRAFVTGYLTDILVPFGFYLLLCLDGVPLGSWIAKSALVFGVGASVEIAQFFGVPLFGHAFDPLDFLMYAMGVLGAVVLDKLVFPRTLRFWKPGA